MLTEIFITRVTALHDNQYDYEIKQETVVAKDKVTIICHTHGKFKSRVHDHLYHKSGCPECARIQKSGKANFIGDAIAKHGKAYDYTNVKYSNNYTAVEIICKTHGSYEQLPYIHLKSVVGCPKCDAANRTKSINDFINEGNKTHKDFYNYDKVNFVNTKHKVEIICPAHGSFWQTPSNHLQGSGCQICGNFKRSKTFNSNRHLRELNKTDKGTIYLMQFSTNREKFIKIGITTQNDINGRFGDTHRGYTIKKLFKKTISMLEASHIEQEILEVFNHKKHIPAFKFGGYTECFVAEGTEEILQYINERIK